MQEASVKISCKYQKILWQFTFYYTQRHQRKFSSSKQLLIRSSKQNELKCHSKNNEIKNHDINNVSTQIWEKDKYIFEKKLN